MWNNKQYYNGLSVLNYWGGSYVQAPFCDITKEEYDERVKSLKFIDLTKVTEVDDNVEFSQVAACAGGSCSIE
jgi:ribonucleoside-diphosphate reductase alpha chain